MIWTLTLSIQIPVVYALDFMRMILELEESGYNAVVDVGFMEEVEEVAGGKMKLCSSCYVTIIIINNFVHRKNLHMKNA